jgi:hypothetical protein
VPLPTIPTAKLTMKHEPFDHPNWLYEPPLSGVDLKLWPQLAHFKWSLSRRISVAGVWT